MICKKKKNKYIYVFLLSLILVCGLLQSSALSCNTYASNTTTVNDYLNSNNFYDVCAYFCRGFASFPDPYGGGTGFTVEAFADYLEEKGKSSILQEPVEVIEDENNSSGGRGYELPQEARQEIINFVNETVIEAEPLSYVGAYIQSYKMLGTSYFSSYSVYQTVLNYMENLSKEQGYIFFIRVENTSSYGYPIQIVSVPTSLNWNFYGTVNSNGLFNNVNLGINWQGSPTLLNVYNYPEYTSYYTGIKFNYIRSDNGAQLSNRWVGNLSCQSFKNQTGLTVGGDWIVLSSSKDKEYVYVFNNMNAYKNYNAGTPQPYYLLSEPNYIAPYTDPVTSTGLQKAGNFYNSIVNNVNAGDTPEQVQKTVKNGLLGNLLDTLTGSNSSTALDVGNFDTSFLGTIKDLVLGVTGAIDPAEQLVNTDLRRFVTDIFGWLPGEIVTFWIAGILFAVLFGVLKIIRG